MPVERTSQPGLSVLGLTREVDWRSSDVSTVIITALDAVSACLDGHPHGAAVVIYTPTGEHQARLHVGHQGVGPAPEGLTVEAIPAGSAAHLCHRGDYGGLPAAHQRIHRWMAQQGRATVGVHWEIYGPWSDDPDQLVTDVYYAL